MNLTDENIKPIPKYMAALIRRTDKKTYPKPCGSARFYAYLTKIQGELVKVTVAVKHCRKKWYCKPVAWHGIHSDKCFVKDLEYCGFVGLGFRIGWHEEGLQSYRKWFERGVCYADDKYYDPRAEIVNPEFVEKFPEYKYSAYKLFRGTDLLKYLRRYEQYPQLEMLMKLGFENIAMSVTVLKRVGKDKNFCRWLLAHKQALQRNYYYIGVIMQAYKTGKSLGFLQSYWEARLCLWHDSTLDPVKELFRTEKEMLAFYEYISAKNTNPHTYLDYLKACNYLQLDMSLPKNRFPHNFRYWHDMRIDQYATARAKADRKAKQEMYKRFSIVAEKYLPLQHNKRSPFICIIAKSPADLIREGEVLDHCVGRMNYDMRVIREESLIFFVRTKEHPNTPFVTVEYSLQNHKVLQCYGEHDHKPSDNVLHYVNKVWLPYANKHLKQIQAAA